MKDRKPDRPNTARANPPLQTARQLAVARKHVLERMPRGRAMIEEGLSPNTAINPTANGYGVSKLVSILESDPTVHSLARKARRWIGQQFDDGSASDMLALGVTKIAADSAPEDESSRMNLSDAQRVLLSVSIRNKLIGAMSPHCIDRWQRMLARIEGRPMPRTEPAP